MIEQKNVKELMGNHIYGKHYSKASKSPNLHKYPESNIYMIANH